MVGIDIENIDKFNNWTDEKLKRIFTENEIEYAKKHKTPSVHFCAFYCVKEALVKALDDKSLKFLEIEVLHTETGKPYISKNKYIHEKLNNYNYKDVEISISHSKDYATAIVIVIR